MKEFTPQNHREIKFLDNNKTIFLGGTIDNGISANWQSHIVSALSDCDVDIYNPRNKKWDITHNPSDLRNSVLISQIEWELFYLQEVKINLFWFEPNSKSPITLMELGLILGLSRAERPNKHIVIYCPPEFYRFVNVVITAKKIAGITVITDKTKVVDKLKEILNAK